MTERDGPEPHEEEPPQKRQKTTENKNDDFENKLTVPIALELGEECRDLELKLLEKCLASSKCDIAQPAKCKCRSCLYIKYGHVVFVPHDGHQDGQDGPGDKCPECISVEGTVRGQYAVEISDHLPLSPEVRHDLACHFRVFREILSKMFSTSVQDLRKRMNQVKIESMPVLQEEIFKLREQILTSSGQLDDLSKKLECIFDTLAVTGIGGLDKTNNLSKPNEENVSTLVHLRKASAAGAESLEEEINRLKTENARLGRKVQEMEEEDMEKQKQYGAQSVPIKFFASDRGLGSV